MATITKYPLLDPVTGEPIDNLKSMPDEIVEASRIRGYSDDEIRTLPFELHDAIAEAKQILRLIMTPDEVTN